jgi:hypothetical protein
MSLLTDASLIVTPNAYNVGKLYSVIPNTTLGDMAVSRGSSATRVNSAKLIEIARTNLLTYSNTFSDASWTKSNITVTANATTAPDLTLTANKLTITTTFGNHQINRLSVVASSQCAMSIYAKADGVTTLTILDGGTANNGSIFNLSTVTVTNVGTGVGTMVSVGDGWYRCITIVTTTGFRLYCPNTSSSAGDGTSGIYIWGAQIEAGETATEYIPTIASIRTKFAGITQDGLLASNIPRIDYPPLGGCPSILVEPARTNLVLYSEEFDNASWSKSGTTISPNTTTSPSGTTTADKIVEVTAASLPRVSPIGTVVTLVPHTITTFAKASERTQIRIVADSSAAKSAYYDLINGTVVNVGASATASITLYNNGWYRCILTYTPSVIGNGFYIATAEAGNTIASGDNTKGVFLWGAQIEAGSNATSYIPTTTAPVPRAADVIRNLSATTLIGQTQGTMYAEIDIKAFDIGAFFTISDGTSVNYIQMYTFNNNRIYCDIYASSVASNINTGITPLSVGTYKVAFAYQSGNSYLYINGAQVGATLAATFTFGSMGKVNIGTGYADSTFFNNRIKSAILFKTRLTPDQCILLTGPSFSSYVEMANNFPNTLIYSLQ